MARNDRALKTRLLSEHQARTRRIHQAITGGRCLQAIAEPDWSHQPDIRQLHNFGPKDYTQPYTLVIYSDGSYKEWYLAASVVWLGPPNTTHDFNHRSSRYGSNTGLVEDTELAGIALALDEAVWQVITSRLINRVVVFSDSKAVVKMLGEGVAREGRNAYLGPITPDGIWPLQNLYDSEQWLYDHGVGVTIYWTPGHNGNLGNETAHEVVTRENHQQIEESGSVDVNRHVRVPAELLLTDTRNQNSDLEKEYLHRQSAPWFHSGAGTCHAAPLRFSSSRSQPRSHRRRQTDSRRPSSRRMLDSWRPNHS